MPGGRGLGPVSSLASYGPGRGPSPCSRKPGIARCRPAPTRLPLAPDASTSAAPARRPEPFAPVREPLQRRALREGLRSEPAGGPGPAADRQVALYAGAAHKQVARPVYVRAGGSTSRSAVRPGPGERGPGWSGGACWAAAGCRWRGLQCPAWSVTPRSRRRMSALSMHAGLVGSLGPVEPVRDSGAGASGPATAPASLPRAVDEARRRASCAKDLAALGDPSRARVLAELNLRWVRPPARGCRPT